MFHFLKNAIWALPLIILFSCCDSKLVTDDRYLKEIEISFAERKKLAENRQQQLFSVFDTGLSKEEEVALKFLFAYMPLSDLADYNGSFFLECTKKALETRSEVPWGKKIPEDIFLHYVLPLRVNNENLDSFRIKCYDEIHERIKGLKLKEAALEINYWCQEKVSYQPADSRTSGPLSTMLSARGRCGEESTFTVAALRTAGIPARQVYTPRWAHSDDNHAWVEVFIDGEWFYMGACEPEPVLDRGWFTEPARRAMLVHTKSFGAPTGDENSIVSHRNFAEVNNLAKYAETKRIYVKVEDTNGKPVIGASVEYKLYNYAEFYSIATVPSDEEGMSSFETGLGDLIVWASKEGLYDWEKISVPELDTVYLKIEARVESGASADLDMMVPPVQDPFPGPSEDLAAANAERVKNGNLIRQKYIDSWIKPAEAVETGRKFGINAEKANSLFSRSMGNYSEIRKFLSATPDSLRNLAVMMLEVLSDKDLRDTRASILLDHIKNIPDGNRRSRDRMFIEYVLNPRISVEILSPWRSYFIGEMSSIFGSSHVKDPVLLVKFLERNLIVADDENYYGTPITPSGVFELRVCDRDSRAICFVAMCRSMGIPARLEPAMKIPQFWENDRWNNVFFEGEEPVAEATASLRLNTQHMPEPEYYSHFTLARLENGRYVTLEYEYNKKATEFGGLELPAGQYMLVTGNRLEDRILTHLRFFDLDESDSKTLEVLIRTDTIGKKILGNIDYEGISGMFSQKDEILQSIRKGIVAAWIEPGLEPTLHIFNDLPLLKSELDEWGGAFLFLTVSEDSAGSFDPSELKGLPVNSWFGSDPDLKEFRKFVKLGNQGAISYPFIIQADSTGNIIFVSAGYRVGLGDTILKNIR